MASKNKGSSGLRILWIPGRKKNHDKGRYDATRKQLNYSSHGQKKIEPWSLGGAKGQEDIIKTDIPSGTDLLMSGTSSVTAAGIALSPATQPDKTERETTDTDYDRDSSNKDDLSMPEKTKSDTSSNTALDHEDVHQYIDSTLKIRRNIDRKTTNYDQIEKYDEGVIGKLPNISDVKTDLPDGQLLIGARNKKDNFEQFKEDKEDDSKAVTCLYYAIACCECSIS